MTTNADLSPEDMARFVPKLEQLSDAVRLTWSPELTSTTLRQQIESNARLEPRLRAVIFEGLGLDPFEPLPDFAGKNTALALLDANPDRIALLIGRTWHADGICRALISNGSGAVKDRINVEDFRMMLRMRPYAPVASDMTLYRDIEKIEAMCREDGYACLVAWIDGRPPPIALRMRYLLRLDGLEMPDDRARRTAMFEHVVPLILPQFEGVS